MPVGERHHRGIQHAHQLQVMGGDDDGGAQLVQLGEQAQQAHPHFRIDIAGRLVGDQDFGLADHRAGNGHALLLAA